MSNTAILATCRNEAWAGLTAPGRISLSGLFDVAVALIALLFLAPLMLVVALAVWVQDGGSAFYSHLRMGYGGRVFFCLKFRSMFSDSSDRLRELLAADPLARAEWERDRKLRGGARVTPIGMFMRKSSLDELPQLFNVLRGEMSLVGPRPIVQAEISRYGRYFQHYCSVRPGITGLWQVSGRNDTSYRRRVALDVAYSRSKSLPLDLRLLVATVPAVIFRRGSY